MGPFCSNSNLWRARGSREWDFSLIYSALRAVCVGWGPENEGRDKSSKSELERPKRDAGFQAADNPASEDRSPPRVSCMVDLRSQESPQIQQLGCKGRILYFPYRGKKTQKLSTF